MVENIIIVCSGKLFDGNSAGAARVMNFSKAFASKGKKVYISSLSLKKISVKNVSTIAENIYKVNDAAVYKNILHKLIFRNNYFSSFIYLRRIAKFARKLNGESCFLLYPSVDQTMEPMCIFVLKRQFGFRIYCEINELRKTNVARKSSAKNKIHGIFAKLHAAIKYKLYRHNEKLSKHFDGLLIISTNLEEYYKKFNSNYIRIPILTDVKLNTSPQKKSLQPGDIFTIGFTGFIDITKEGFDIFYNALGKFKKEFNKFELHLYGHYIKNESGRLKRIALENNIEKNIIYHGHVKQTEIFECTKKHHLLILPRGENPQTKYGFSTKLAEYMISGTPVLVTNISDNGLFIKDGENGFIIEKADATLFYKKLLYIIKNYNQFGETIPVNAFRTARQHFDFSNYADAMVQLIENRK
ncbi:MAG: glycosyltransferase family 4 protein [Bacteroidota bacterium]